MATGYSRLLEGGHDMIYDYCCTTCDHKNLNAEAFFYCMECRKLFCEGCEQYHDKFTEGHNVLGRKEVANWGNVKPVTSSLICDEHPGKELELFCEDHGCVCCHTCISVNHRSCKQVTPVSVMAEGIRTKPLFKSLLSKATNTQSRLKSLYDKQENNIKMLEKARGEIIATFKNLRKKLKDTIDRLEKESITELERLLSMLNEQVTSDKDTCSNFIGKIQKLLNDIQTLDKQCDALVFHGYKKYTQQIASAEELLSLKQGVDYCIKFIPDAKIEQYLSSLKTLGSFHVTPRLIHSDLGSLKNAEMIKPATSDHEYSVVKKQSYNVKTSGDTETVEIVGMCQLPDGHTVIVDNRNTEVKLLSASTYVVLDELKLPRCPQDICYIKGRELAVTVCDMKDRHKIQFIDAVNGKLTHTRTVKLDHECFGIAYHSDLLYVGSRKALYIYNVSGKKIKKIYKNPDDKNSALCRFSFSDDGSRIYMTEFNKHLLLTLDNSGQQLSTFSDHNLKNAFGVCVADNGSVFVCGTSSNTVLQVDREGKKRLTTLVAENDGIFRPESVCYDRKTHTLLIGQSYSESLQALDLK